MATATPLDAPTQAVADPLDRPFRLTLDRYLRLIEAGILNEKDRVYLWKGRLVAKMTKGPDHFFTVSQLYWLLTHLLPNGWFVIQEQPLLIPDDGVPEPDLTVVRGRLADFRGRLVTSQEAALVIEVADSSLAYDRGAVLEVYAAQRIPVYWVVNFRDRCIEVYTDPVGPSGSAFYRLRTIYGPQDEVPVLLDGREVGSFAVGEILP